MRTAVCLAAAFLLPAVPVLAQEPARERPQVLARLFECRNVPTERERLACYEQAAAALETAEAQSDLVIMDRQQVRDTRRTLFGLTLPNIDIFSRGDDGEEGIETIESTIRSATRNGLDKWILTLEDGARWIQLDSRELPRDPRGGQAIRIRRAAMGSYLANIDGQVAIRVRRER